MGKVIDKGSKGPDDPIYREGWGVSAVYRPDPGGHQPPEPEKKSARRWQWRVLPVDPHREHFQLLYGSTSETDWKEWEVIARVGPPVDDTFAVQWLVEPSTPAHAEAVKAVQEELDFYLVELRERDPWGYARYHCGTSSNLYSRVHWTFREAKKDPPGHNQTPTR